MPGDLPKPPPVPRWAKDSDEAEKSRTGATVRADEPTARPKLAVAPNPPELESAEDEPSHVRPLPPRRKQTILFAGAPKPGVKRQPLPDRVLDRRATRRTEHARWGTAIDAEEPITPSAIQFKSGDEVPGTRYRIRDWIGEGGMGVVYEAEHMDIERRVALKILRSHISGNPEIVRRFRDEARTASMIGSENIAEVYDFAELPDHRVLFTMELLSGRMLSEELEHGALEPARCVGILRQVCKGLAAAHRAGVVHRDIKPENIALETRNHRADVVKIVDFGISTVMAEGQSGADVMAGTPHYLAPEMVAGTAFDARADIYAVGCTAYEMLVGTPPHNGETVRQVLEAHLSNEAVPPSKAALGSKPVPEALDHVVLRCLAKEPDDRYHDMLDLEAALCEAQVEADLATPWDDLPLPEVDPERRSSLVSAMPDMVEPLVTQPIVAGTRGWLWPLVAVAALILAGAVGYGMRSAEPEARVQEPSMADWTDELVTEARTLAAQGYYVLGPPDDPDHATAFRAIQQLEAVGHPTALEQAGALRQEFAAALTRQADDLWEQDGGKQFAVDYYIQAHQLDPENTRAASRANLSPEQLAVLQGELPVPDLEPEPEPEADATEGAPAIDTEGGSPAEDEGETEAAPEQADGDEPEPSDDAGVPEPADNPEQPSKPASSKRPTASALARQSDAAFNKGRYKSAAAFAKRALVMAPNNAGYHLKLGDAYFKLGKKDAARAAYAKAAKLGHKGAKWRIEKLEGKSPKKKTSKKKKK